jgi:hypothetical protein
MATRRAAAPRGIGPEQEPTGMNRHLIAILLVTVSCLVGCAERIGDYVAASSITRNGYAGDGEQTRNVHGQEIRVWGFIDHGNLYTDADGRRILGDWWSGDGPNATTWRFDLKARADDATGHGFPVRVPNDPGRDQLLWAFAADARAGRPTRVFVTGRIYAFVAPTNTSTLTGLYLEPRSSREIRLDSAD